MSEHTLNLNFVLSPDFHGTTALALLLNNHSRISAFGDGNPFRPFDAMCTCRRPVSQCGFWSEVGKKLDTSKFANQMNLLPFYPDIVRVNRLDTFLSKGLSLLDAYWNLGLWDVSRSGVKRYARVYRQFHRVVCELQGTELFVSGSKNLTEVLLQRRFSEGVDRVKVIHVARDPRGYFHSTRKHYGHTLRKATRSWKLWHGAIRRLGMQRPGIDYLFVQYEEFCRDPRQTMERIFGFLGVENQEVCTSPRNLNKHHIAGHEMAFGFNGIVRADDSWRQSLASGQQREILARTLPLSEMFGYTWEGV